MWRIEGLQTGFCVQLLVDPAQLDVAIPRGARPLRADAIEDLSPCCATVVANQPEFASWTPSRICLYYMETVDVGSLRVTRAGSTARRRCSASGPSPRRTRAGEPGQDVVLRLFTNTGRLERAAEVSGLDLRKVRSTVAEHPQRG